MRKNEADNVRAIEQARRAEKRRARDEAVAREQQTHDDGAAEDARKLLVDWSAVKVERHGAFWLVGGRSMAGRPWSTTGADPVAAAARLVTLVADAGAPRVRFPIFEDEGEE